MQLSETKVYALAPDVLSPSQSWIAWACIEIPQFVLINSENMQLRKLILHEKQSIISQKPFIVRLLRIYSKVFQVFQHWQALYYCDTGIPHLPHHRMHLLSDSAPILIPHACLLLIFYMSLNLASGSLSSPTLFAYFMQLAEAQMTL